MNFYPFHIGDYISHTSHLTDAEDLAYRRMIDLYYQTEKSFTDISWVARKVKSTPEIVKTLLEEFFEFTEDGAYRNKRADEEIAKYQAKADSARKANLKRWQTDSDKKPNLESDVKSDASRILTKNQEPRTKTSKATTEKIELPAWLPEKNWQEWLEYRRSAKKPMSDLAMTKFLNQLQTFVTQGYDPIKLLDTAIASSWTTVYARDDAKKTASVGSNLMKGVTYART